MANERKTGMGSHQSSRMFSDEWLTPPEIIQSLGHFDLDPCSPIKRPWPTADKHYTIQDNGLYSPWAGRVYMNPPYGRQMEKWMAKMAAHGNGIALIFARTETNTFFKYVWEHADAILFLKGRLTFYKVDGTKGHFNGGAPSCLIAYGKENHESLFNCGLEGKLISLK